MGLFRCYVYYPWKGTKDSSHRVSIQDNPPEYKREFVLNTNRILGIESHVKGSTFGYTDNPDDAKEGISRVVCDNTVSDVIGYVDDNATVRITLPVLDRNDLSITATDTTIRVSAIAYADVYNLDPSMIWVNYAQSGFKMVRALVDMTFDELMATSYGSITVDSTIVTVDDTIIEVDNN